MLAAMLCMLDTKGPCYKESILEMIFIPILCAYNSTIHSPTNISFQFSSEMTVSFAFVEVTAKTRVKKIKIFILLSVCPQPQTIDVNDYFLI